MVHGTSQDRELFGPALGRSISAPMAIAAHFLGAASQSIEAAIPHDNVMEATAVENNVVEDSRITVVG